MNRGFGLIGMQERSQRQGDSLHLTSRIGQGTKIIVTVIIVEVELTEHHESSPAHPNFDCRRPRRRAAGLAAIIEDEADMQVVAQARTDNRQWNSTATPAVVLMDRLAARWRCRHSNPS